MEGIKQLKNHHEKIHKLIEKLDELRSKDPLPHDIMLCFYKLTYITENYIFDEELFQTKVNYPHLESHKTEHRKFISKLQSLYAAYTEQPTRSTNALYELLYDWNENHIKVSDKKLLDYAEAKNLI